MLQEIAAATGKRIVFYCAFGERSAMAVQAAQELTECTPGAARCSWRHINKKPPSTTLGGFLATYEID